MYVYLLPTLSIQIKTKLLAKTASESGHFAYQMEEDLQEIIYNKDSKQTKAGPVIFTTSLNTMLYLYITIQTVKMYMRQSV